MKYLIAVLTVAFFSFSAEANTFFTQCEFEDWSRIRAALDSGAVDAKPSVLKQLKYVIDLEFGPVCEQEISLLPSATPSTRENFTYVVSHGHTRFQILISYDRINDFFSYVGVDRR